MQSTPARLAPPIAAVDQGLGALSDRIRRAARRSYWFSWFSWGFLISLSISTILVTYIYLEFAVTTVASTPSGVSTVTSGPWWAFPVGYLPSFVLLGLAVRELLLGRREARTGSPAPAGIPSTPASQSEGGWIAAVQQAQKSVTHMKNETDFSFVPLVLGVLALGEIGLSSLLLFTGESLAIGALAVVLVTVLGALAFILPLVPLYLIGRAWVRSYQTLLDRQVGDLSRLEAEFLWRFMGTPA
jgi:hypothetical protein